MMQIEGHSFPLIVYAGPFFLWVVFYMLGIWFSTHSREHSLVAALVLLVAGYLASVFESMIYLPLHGGGLGIKLSSFIFSAGVIMLMFSSKMESLFRKNKFMRMILYLGEISFGIYLLHMYVRVALSHVMPGNSWLLNWIFTLALTVALIAFSKKVLPRHIAIRYFGLR